MRITAHIISVVFHPLLILTYMLVLLLLVNPYLFGVNSLREHSGLVLRVFFTTFFLPAFAIFLMQRLEFTDKQERIIPFIATGIFYLWVFRSVSADTQIPTAFLIAVLGTTMGLFICFLINLFFKISIHATGMGGLVGIVLISMWLFSYGTFDIAFPLLGHIQVSMSLLLMLSIITAGLVGTARLWLKAHTPRELYFGYFIGLASQFIALKILV
jgi:hypothetical protein